MTPAESWLNHRVIAGRDVTHIRRNQWRIVRLRWWHRFSPRHRCYARFPVIGRQITANDLLRMFGNPKGKP